MLSLLKPVRSVLIDRPEGRHVQHRLAEDCAVAVKALPKKRHIAVPDGVSFNIGLGMSLRHYVIFGDTPERYASLRCHPMAGTRVPTPGKLSTLRL